MSNNHPRKTAHYWVSSGDGEFSRNRFRSLCQPTGEPVFVPADQRNVTDPTLLPAGVEVCPTCREVADILNGRVRT